MKPQFRTKFFRRAAKTQRYYLTSEIILKHENDPFFCQDADQQDQEGELDNPNSTQIYEREKSDIENFNQINF